MKESNPFLTFIKANKKILLEILGIFLILFIYEIISIGYNDPLFLPSLSIICKNVISLCSKTTTYIAFGESLARTVVSVLISIASGFILGTLAGYFNEVRYVLNPLVSIMKLVPTPCVIFLIFLFFYRDLNFGSVIITFIVIFPIIYESFIAGHDNLNESIKLSLKLEGYYSPKCFFKVILPESTPYISLGIVNSLALGVKISIMSEILLGSSQVQGIGTLLNNFRINSDYANMFALIFLILFIFILFDLLIKIIKKFMKN